MTSEPDTGSMQVLAAYPTHMARELAERLTASGIPAALRPQPLGRGTRGTPSPGDGTPRVAARGGYGANVRLDVLVAVDDLERARQIESRFVRDQVPDLPEGFDPDAQPDDRCPACQAPLDPPDIDACPDCGLSFSG